MPRPTNKPDLLAAMEKEHAALVSLLETLSAEQFAVTSETIEAWSPKDVIAHVTAWEQMCLGWYRAGLCNEEPPLPAKGFKWNQIPALNQQIYQQNRLRPAAEIRAAFDASYAEMQRTVDALTDADLFTPQRYRWTGKNAMGTYFVSATSSHYVWARKEIKQCLKRQATVMSQ